MNVYMYVHQVGM